MDVNRNVYTLKTEDDKNFFFLSKKPECIFLKEPISRKALIEAVALRKPYIFQPAHTNH